MIYAILAAIPYVNNERTLYEKFRGISFPALFVCLLVFAAILAYAFKRRR
jgi:hypothetical protein